MPDNTLTITNARIITPNATIENGWLRAEDGVIVDMQPGTPPTASTGRTIHAEQHSLMPGFIDLHVHGANGHDMMDATPEALTAMARFFARYGVTGFMATTWTDSHKRMLAALQAVAVTTGEIEDGATLLGAHMEGPYLNPAKCGAQNRDHLRPIDMDELKAYLATDAIKLVTIAPELGHSQEAIATIIKSGAVASAGHTDATYDQLRAAINAGLSHATHTFNGMRGLHHRDPGAVGAVLAHVPMTAELIADTVHVHPAVMKLLWLAKRRNQAILVTDGTRATGLPAGETAVDGRTVQVRDGAVWLPDGTLAGTTLTMNVALKNFVAATAETLDNVWTVTSWNAAQVAGVADRTGELVIGKQADLALLDEDFNVRLTVVRGKVVYENLESVAN